MFLEDSEWEKAIEYCERVLDMNPECGEAYLGRLMVAFKVNKREDLAACREPFEENPYFLKARRYGDENLNKFLDDCIERINARNKRESMEKTYNDAFGLLGEAERGKDLHIYEQAISEFEEIDDSVKRVWSQVETTDKVFVLSATEIEDYGIYVGGAKVTDDVARNYPGVFTNGDTSCAWWLRSDYTPNFGPGGQTVMLYQYAGMKYYSSAWGGYDVYDECCGIRPAIWIELEEWMTIGSEVLGDCKRVRKQFKG